MSDEVQLMSTTTVAGDNYKDTYISKISSGQDSYKVADVDARLAIKNLGETLSDFIMGYSNLQHNVDFATEEAKKYTDMKLKGFELPIWDINVDGGGITGNIWLENKPVWEK